MTTEHGFINVYNVINIQDAERGLPILKNRVWLNIHGILLVNSGPTVVYIDERKVQHTQDTIILTLIDGSIMYIAGNIETFRRQFLEDFFVFKQFTPLELQQIL